jgi:hypothetical protein
VADGFGVSLHEFKEIMAELTDELGLNRAKMDERAIALFGVFDTDKVSINGAVVEGPCGRAPPLRPDLVNPTAEWAG